MREVSSINIHTCMYAFMRPNFERKTVPYDGLVHTVREKRQNRVSPKLIYPSGAFRQTAALDSLNT